VTTPALGGDGFQFDVIVDDGSHVPWWGAVHVASSLTHVGLKGAWFQPPFMRLSSENPVSSRLRNFKRNLYRYFNPCAHQVKTPCFKPLLSNG
jgi:hypothetical protein